MANDNHYRHPATGTTAYVTSKCALAVDSVSIKHLGGFTGSYMDGPGSKTYVTTNGQTHTIRGSAQGFDRGNPSERTAGTFTIRVAC
ncbi:lipoprotein LpqH [Mycobacterium paraintracellulare]|uniref:lipoprotein LpqH n=1 Tax=Mycobacterium paraintracellulare TaxID=1138383 RepID=UPI001925DDA1|nr:lipoprotein LpqH [Mycobacterium paraintracellulare]